MKLISSYALLIFCLTAQSSPPGGLEDILKPTSFEKSLEQFSYDDALIPLDVEGPVSNDFELPDLSEKEHDPTMVSDAANEPWSRDKYDALTGIALFPEEEKIFKDSLLSSPTVAKSGDAWEKTAQEFDLLYEEQTEILRQLELAKPGKKKRMLRKKLRSLENNFLQPHME